MFATSSTSIRPLERNGGNTWSAAFVASVFFIFVEYMRPQEKYEIFSGMPFGQIAILMVVISSVISGTGISLSGASLKWTAALLLWVLLTCAFSASPGTGLESYWETLKVVGIYFFVVASIRTRTQLYYLIISILVLYFLHTNFSIRGWVLSGFAGLPRGTYVGSGFFRNPNDFGAALAAFWGISLLLATIDTGKFLKRIPYRWLYIVSTALFLGAVLTSSSRGAALAVAAGSTFYIFVYTKGVKQKVAWALLGAIAVVSFIYLLSEGQLDRFSGMGGEDDASAQDRIRTWAVAWQIIQDYPLTGIGLGQFGPTAALYAPGEVIFVPHNIFLQIAAYAGYPGLILVLAILFAFFRSLRTSLRQLRSLPKRDKLLEAIAIGTSVSMFSFVIAGQFITVLFYPFMWVLIAIGAALERIVRRAFEDSVRTGHSGTQELPGYRTHG